MTRTTRADLEMLAHIISHALVCEANGTRCERMDRTHAYVIEYAYGRPRLVSHGGSVDVSPRLPAGELAQWMRAYIDGIEAGRRHRDSGECMARGHWDANGSGDWHCIHERCACLPGPTIEVLTREPDGFTAIIGEGAS